MSTLIQPHSRMSTIDVSCLAAVYTFYFKKSQYCQYLQEVIKSLARKTGAALCISSDTKWQAQPQVPLCYFM